MDVVLWNLSSIYMNLILLIISPELPPHLGRLMHDSKFQELLDSGSDMSFDTHLLDTREFKYQILKGMSHNLMLVLDNETILEQAWLTSRKNYHSCTLPLSIQTNSFKIRWENNFWKIQIYGAIDYDFITHTDWYTILKSGLVCLLLLVVGL